MLDESGALRDKLVDQLKQTGETIRSAPVEAAFRAAPRHLFVPDADLERAYSDNSIPTKLRDGIAISSSSQPAIMAVMLEQLDLRPGQRVLEIGAGTGYNAALLAHIAGQSGHVTTIDIDEDITEAAREHLRAAGYPQVQVITADGGYGYPPGAPYDRIIATVSVWDIPPAWIEQLAPDGRMVLPLAVAAQVSVALVREGEGLASVDTASCGFMTLRGAFADPDNPLDLGPEPTLKLSKPPSGVDAQQVYRWLTGPYCDIAFENENFKPRGGLTMWLALAEPGLNTLLGSGAAKRWVPPFSPEMPGWDQRLSSGLIEPGGMALWLRLPETDPPRYGLRVYGDQGEALAQRLIEHMRAWEAAGCPGGERIRVRVFPEEASVQPAPGEILVPKLWNQLLVRWEEA